MLPRMPSREKWGRKWRRFRVENQRYFFAIFFLILILALVALLFWMLSRPRFQTTV